MSISRVAGSNASANQPYHSTTRVCWYRASPFASITQSRVRELRVTNHTCITYLICGRLRAPNLAWAAAIYISLYSLAGSLGAHTDGQETMKCLVGHNCSDRQVRSTVLYKG